MHREKLMWLRLGAIVSDSLMLAGAWAAWVFARSLMHVDWLQPVDPGLHWPLAALVVPAWLTVLQLRGSYTALRRKDPAQVASRLLVSTSLALMVVLAILFALKLDYVSRSVVVGFAVLSVPTLVLSRWLQLWSLRRLRRGHFDPHRVLLAGAEGEAAPFRDAVRHHPEWGIEIVGRCEVDAVASHILRDHIDEVYLTGGGLGFDTLRQVASVCDDTGVRLSMDANFLGLTTSRAELTDFEGWNLLTFTSGSPRSAELVAKRLMDMTLAAAALLVLSPMLAALAAAIRLSDGGPALFVQERSGRFGRPFAMYKFRTMVVDAENRLDALREHNQADGPVFKMHDDPRITRLGHFLRRSSLDELPQLINVLLGQMSLVGPRPPIPSEVARYERWQLRRLSMKPGLTCIWQVSGRSELSWDRWMELDLEYIDNWSLGLDVSLLIRTVPAVLSGQGAR